MATSKWLIELLPRNLGWLSAIFLLIAFQIGCNGSRVTVPATVPVKGIVKVNGEPTSGIRVKFHKERNTHTLGYIPTGETGPDGGFTLSTGAPLNGAPPGTYVVTFEQPIIDPLNPVETEIDGFLGKYSDPLQSKWTVKIERGENTLQAFDLQ